MIEISRSRSTEVDAYIFIKENLKTLGWNKKNPSRHSEGQVYTQHECHSHEEIHRCLGRQTPENIVKVTNTILWIIEAKREHRQLEQAINQAKGYAEKINESSIIQAKFISGVAGNDTDGYIIKNKYFDGTTFQPIKFNNIETTGLLSPDETNTIVRTNNPSIEDVPINDRLFMSKAEKINEILHLGAINPNQRASVMSALLLSMLDDTPPNIDASPSVLIGDINTRVRRVLNSQGKPEFYDYMRLSLPSAEDNHLKFRNAIVSTLQELHILNIRSAMNSGTDVLGKFYEEFLKYANWAKELGIVLTPRHITHFAANVMSINQQDIVYDPCCGTGGFLVSAFDYVKKNSNQRQINRFKQNNLFGIEQDQGVASLAVVNMIFRGDGKNNIFEGNCFAKFLESSTSGNVATARYVSSLSEDPPVTKILMNPPFALKSSDEKEYKFINHALKQMQDGGVLFSILPYSVLVKGGQYLNWRKELLDHNTLLSVITFPDDLFYPIGVHTVGIFIKKGIRHPREQNVLWIRALNDGHVKSKGKRLWSDRAEDDFNLTKDTLRAFLVNPTYQVSNMMEFQKACQIDFEDHNLELVPEVYLDTKRPSITELESNLDKTLRELISFMIQEDKMGDFREIITEELFEPIGRVQMSTLIEVPLTQIFLTPIKTGIYHVSGLLNDGNIPLISCSSINAGVEKFVDVPSTIVKTVRGSEEVIQSTYQNAITIASDGRPLTSFYHYYPFCAKDNVMVCFPKEKFKITTMIFIVSELNSLKWRFSYGRKCYLNKVHKIQIFLPIRDNGIDEDYIEYLVKKTRSWNILRKLFENNN